MVQENKGFSPSSPKSTLASITESSNVSVSFDKSLQKVDTLSNFAPDEVYESSSAYHEADDIEHVLDTVDRRTLRLNSHISDEEVTNLASRALKILSSRTDQPGSQTPFAQLFALADAYIDPEDKTRHDILARILRRGVSPEQVVDEVVPATARYMGKLWTHDKLSFAEVTIGTARLQETVRAMTIRKPRSIGSDSEKPRVLLAVPRSEHHTLGIFVLSEQFRRLNCTVQVMIGSQPREIIEVLREQPCDLIGFSMGSQRSVVTVREMIRTIRAGHPRRTPICVGGAIMGESLNVKALTGADFATSGAKHALEQCGIISSDIDVEIH